AIAAEAGEVHQVDVLHVGAGAQVLHQPAEGCGLQLGNQRLVELGHVPTPCLPASCAPTVDALTSFVANLGAGVGSRKSFSMMRQSRLLQADCPPASRIKSCRISTMALASPRWAPCCHRQSPSSCPA